MEEHASRRRIGRHGGIALAATLALAFGLGLAPAQSASATYSSNGLGTGLTYVNYFSYNATWQTPMNQAIANWNTTATPVDIQKVAGGNVVSAGAIAATWYGYYNRLSTSFTIQLNSNKLSACANFANCVKSVLVHEFGHAFYQADNPPVSNTQSVMVESRDRNSAAMTVPKTYDINETDLYL